MKQKKRLLYVFSILMCIFISISASAQQTVKGILRTPTGDALAGATISIKGTTTSTTSNSNGEFSINAPVGSVLVISYVGYVEQEVTVSDGSTLNIQLQPTSQELTQVVVIGYQTVRKRDLTGATSVVNTQNTQRIVSRSLPEQLQGMAAGVTVRTGGAPGQEAVVNIRGLSTVFGNGNPLYVIDGMFADPNTTV